MACLIKKSDLADDFDKYFVKKKILMIFYESESEFKFPYFLKNLSNDKFFFVKFRDNLTYF